MNRRRWCASWSSRRGDREITHLKVLAPTFALLILCLTARTASSGRQTGSKPKLPQAKSQPHILPNLGDELPATLLRPKLRTCDTGESRQEPCAVLTVRNERITVAWDETTKRITYLYSATLATDDDLRAGDVLPIASDLPVTPFPNASVPHRFVSADWCDTAADLSRDALWCAVMVPARPRSGKVLGFVQSIYLDLPNPDAPLLHRTARHIPHTPSRLRKSSTLESR